MKAQSKFFLGLSLVTSILSLYCIIYNLITVGKVETYVPFTEIPIGVNCNYFAVVVSVCIVYLVDQLMRKKIDNSIRLWILIMVIFLMITLLLLTSRTAIITVMMILVLYAFDFVIRTKKYLFLGLPIVFIGLGILILQNSRFGSNRLDKLVDNIKTLDVRKIFPNRIDVYHAAWEAIQERPITGYGISGAQKVLMTKYEKYGYAHPYKYKYHSHNQYLQFGLYGGIGLIIVLFSMLLFPILYSADKFLWSSISAVFGMTFITDAPLTDWRIFLIFIAITLISFFKTNFR